MPEANPFAQYVGGDKPAAGANPFSQYVESDESSGGGMLSDVVPEIKKSFSGNLDALKQGLHPTEAGSVLGGLKSTGAAIAAVPGMAFSPLTGAVRSIGGHALANTEHAIGSVIAPETAAKDDPRKMYEQAANDAEFAMSAVAPSRGGLGAAVRPGTPPPAPPTGPLGVTLSEGQKTGELPLIRKEQAAVRGQLGTSSEGRAKQFFEQQSQEVAQAQDTVTRSLDPFGAKIAESPQEAGAVVSGSVQNAAAQRKAAVGQAYDYAKSLPGEIDASAFKTVTPDIKTALSNRPDPVVIDDKLTPFASKAIQDIESRVSNLQIQNRADPLGQPNPQSISGITLQGVDQMRRRLSTFRSDAYASGNAADGRAAKGVLDAFDDHIDKAINGGLFNGDPRAVQAWNTARSAHADYKSTFTGGKNDPIGRVVEKIVGNKNNPAAIPNDVADFLYGSAGVNPNSLNVGVANRVKGILGERSPEWSAVKQGLFSRMIEPGTGQTDFGPGRIAQRINKFLNSDGKEMAAAVFSPQDRALMQQYADLHRALEIPKTGANWSETSTFLAPMLKKISSGIAWAIGGALGSMMAPGFHGLGEVIGGSLTSKGAGVVSDFKNVRQITKQMPIAIEATNKWQKALAAYNKANSPPSRVALSVATTNLARSLKPLGVELGGVLANQGTAETEAKPNQQ